MRVRSGGTLAAVKDSYAQLTAIFDHHHHLRSAAEVLEWDAAVMMPPRAADLRGSQLAALRVGANELLASSRTRELLDAVEETSLDDWQRSNVALMRRAHVHASAVPNALVEARAKVATACETTWRGARRDADFARLAPLLGETVRIMREVAHAKAEALGVSPYEALADEYEPGVRIADLDALFETLASELPTLVFAIMDRQAREAPAMPLAGPFPTEKQAALGRSLAARLGFDFEQGRLDVSTHPFCGGSPEDVRMTTRFDEADFLTGVMSTVHETGHALYELGLPREWVRQPVGKAVGMAMHESQSLLVEMQACRSPEFLTFFAPLAREHLGRSEDPAFSVENLLRHSLRVERGFIRVDADEVTYPLHVILRYRLERALVANELEIGDLPSAWNEAMRALLGVVPPDDRLGCLQDVHWPSGTFGYFPSYTMGAIAASQLFRAACAADADVRGKLAVGDFRPLLSFLRMHVHGQGSRFGTQELLERVTGKRLDPSGFLKHLRERYLGAV